MDTQEFAVYHLSDGADPSAMNKLAEQKGFYKIVWVREGTCIYRAGNERYDTGASRMHCIGAGSRLSLDAPLGCDGYVILLGHRFINEHYGNDAHISSCHLHRYFENNPVFQVKPAAAAPMNDTLLFLLNGAEKNSRVYDDIQERYLRLFLLYFMQHLLNLKLLPFRPSPSRLTQRYLQLVNEHYAEKKAVCQYAGILYVTASYLNKVVKDETGLTAREHIQQRIIAEAKHGLYSSGLSMKEVAFSLGYDDIAHFSKFFKKVCGYNFSDLKRNMTNRHAVM
ncbi:helix-turn-helix domain-containing protein [Chitinophaga sp. CF418]|uniref:AraC family transcriptional regulator n=1 Tax=Chitinophaga sp. CF418 TaxID=1855287 RepID=UPI00091F5ED4|nr:helix-turn-helix domain-containing protein [Chitinophaga sp. CF418]SHN35988.1 Helix-turn-helix domain-containing protein [Chitinophaga sp. CF418]